MGAQLVALAILLLGGVAALATGRSPRRCTSLAVGALLIATPIALLPAVGVLLGGAARSLRLGWEIPYGTLSVGMDALSAFFVLAIFVVAPVCAVWGGAYLRDHHAEKSLAPSWFFFNFLVASMVLVVIARNAMLFLVAWEVMALSSFFLVTFDDEEERVRDAGWTYLVATHLGTAFLLVLFVALGATGGSLDFDRFAVAVDRRRHAVSARAGGIRRQGRLRAFSRLAAGGPSGGAQPRLRGDVGADDQDRNLRAAPRSHLSRPATGVVGLAAGSGRPGLRRSTASSSLSRSAT